VARRDRLGCLAEAHVIGKQQVFLFEEPPDAVALVRIRRALQRAEVGQELSHAPPAPQSAIEPLPLLANDCRRSRLRIEAVAAPEGVLQSAQKGVAALERCARIVETLRTTRTLVGSQPWLVHDEPGAVWVRIRRLTKPRPRGADFGRDGADSGGRRFDPAQAEQAVTVAVEGTAWVPRQRRTAGNAWASRGLQPGRVPVGVHVLEDREQVFAQPETPTQKVGAVATSARRIEGQESGRVRARGARAPG
jgi:hypothetical protein